MRFRPCIDLREGVVVQIVGATLADQSRKTETNFSSEQPATYFAQRYREDGLNGGHVIMLGPGSEKAATLALQTFPQGLQIGGGVNPENGPLWMERGASGVILTSYLFEETTLQFSLLEKMAVAVGAENLIVDLSCIEVEGRFYVTTDRWKTVTDFEIAQSNLEKLAVSCSEFLVHATRVEGKQSGIDSELVRLLADITPLPTTYAGGIASLHDVEMVAELGQDRLDFTVGSALDLFGGTGVKYEELVKLYGAQN